MKKRLTIMFWKVVGILIDIRPRKIPVEYFDRPIASTDIILGKGEYDYPEGVVVLYEWDEKGKHWIIFIRK